tara:strand:+ start:366 stop:836 length:471 start_codon:yes stop_codon:yes gene_type:complete
LSVAIFAAGCFWGVESTFQSLKGVLNTSVGYIGGSKENPTYEEVCYSSTGHAEAVRVEFNPSIITYEELLNCFWNLHDPTTLNRQGPDVGEQYRSAIFFSQEEEEEEAKLSREKLNISKKFSDPIVTEITSASTFWPAEEYHQSYFLKRGITGGCH